MFALLIAFTCLGGARGATFRDHCSYAEDKDSQSACLTTLSSYSDEGSQPTSSCGCDKISTAISCGVNIYECKVCNEKGVTSQECKICLKGVGQECCGCAARALGLVSESLQGKVCDICESLYAVSGTGTHNSAVTKSAGGVDDQHECHAVAKPAGEKDAGKDVKALIAQIDTASRFQNLQAVKDACESYAPKQKAARLMQLSADLAKEAMMLTSPLPGPRKHKIATPLGETIHVPQHALGCSFSDVACEFNRGGCRICKYIVAELVGLSEADCLRRCPTMIYESSTMSERPYFDRLAFKCRTSLCSKVLKVDPKAAPITLCEAADFC